MNVNLQQQLKLQTIVPESLRSLVSDSMLLVASNDAWCRRDAAKGQHLVDVQQALLGNTSQFTVVDDYAVHKNPAMHKFTSIKALSKVDFSKIFVWRRALRIVCFILFFLKKGQIVEVATSSANLWQVLSRYDISRSRRRSRTCVCYRREIVLIEFSLYRNDRLFACFARRIRAQSKRRIWVASSR